MDRPFLTVIALAGDPRIPRRVILNADHIITANAYQDLVVVKTTGGIVELPAADNGYTTAEELLGYLAKALGGRRLPTVDDEPF